MKRSRDVAGSIPTGSKNSLALKQAKTASNIDVSATKPRVIGFTDKSNAAINKCNPFTLAKNEKLISTGRISKCN